MKSDFPELMQRFQEEIAEIVTLTDNEFLNEFYDKNGSIESNKAYEKIDTLFEEFAKKINIDKREAVFLFFDDNTRNLKDLFKSRSGAGFSSFSLNGLYALLRVMRENSVFNSCTINALTKVFYGLMSRGIRLTEKNAYDLHQYAIKKRKDIIDEYRFIDVDLRKRFLGNAPLGLALSVLPFEKELSWFECTGQKSILNRDFFNLMEEKELWMRLPSENILPFLQKEFCKIDFNLISTLNMIERKEFLKGISTVIFYAARKNIKALDFFIDREFDFTQEKYFNSGEDQYVFSQTKSVYSLILGSKSDPRSIKIAKTLHEKGVISIFKSYPFILSLVTPIVDKKNMGLEMQTMVDEISLNYQSETEFNL